MAGGHYQRPGRVAGKKMKAITLKCREVSAPTHHRDLQAAAKWSRAARSGGLQAGSSSQARRAQASPYLSPSGEQLALEVCWWRAAEWAQSLARAGEAAVESYFVSALLSADAAVGSSSCVKCRHGRIVHRRRRDFRPTTSAWSIYGDGRSSGPPSSSRVQPVIPRSFFFFFDSLRKALLLLLLLPPISSTAYIASPAARRTLRRASRSLAALPPPPPTIRRIGSRRFSCIALCARPQLS